MTQQLFYRLPEIEDTGPLEQGPYSWLSVIIPEASVNLVTNPSFETNTTNYTGIGSASLARSTAQQRFGAYSLAITMAAANNGGVQLDIGTLTAGQDYTGSVWVLAPAGMRLRLFFADTSNNRLGGETQFVGTGFWQRVSVTYRETSTTSRRLLLRKDTDVRTGIVYVDGFQVEAKAYATTYIDGDQQGFLRAQVPPAYLWDGTPHASTSRRSALTNAGGRPMPLSTYGLILVALLGLGLADAQPIATPYAVRDGSSYQGSRDVGRTLTIVGRISDVSFRALQDRRGQLRAALKGTLPGQPVLILHQERDACGAAMSREVALPCVYTGGLEGDSSNRVAEQVTARMQMYLPAILSTGEEAGLLDLSDTLSGTGFIAEQLPDGSWSNMGGGTNNTVNAAIYDPNGANLYAGGAFTTAGGTTVNRVARYNTVTQAWATMGTGASNGFNGAVNDLAIGPDGAVYALGLFTQNSGGTVTYNRIARYDPATDTWSAMSTGIPVAAVRKVAVAPNGVNVAVTAASTSVYIWNGSTWATATLPGGFTAAQGAVYDAAGRLHIAVSDGTGGGIYRGDPSGWTLLGVTPASQDVYELGFDSSGYLYAAGVMTSVGGITVNFVSRYNGTTWETMAGGVTCPACSPGTAGIYASAYDRALNQWLFAGLFTTAGGLPALDGVARWTGSIWVPNDADFAGSPVIRAIDIRPDRRTVFGGDTFASVTTSGSATLTNTGTAPAAPVITLTGPMTPISLRNITTGKNIYFNGLSLSAGERATLDLTPGRESFVSTFQGNIIGKIAPASDLTGFQLAPGANQIRVLATGTTGASAAAARWRPSFASLDDTVD
jgi:hypothetical protein